MDDSEIRKERNEKLLKSMGVSINPSLPLIKSEAEAKLRSPQDVLLVVLLFYVRMQPLLMVLSGMTPSPF